MTATVRVSEIKNPGKHGTQNKDGKPRAGTPLREKYDRLRMGEIVRLGRSKRQLIDFYGMDIVTDRSQGSRLVGEWDGPYYVPIERIVAGAASE